MAELTQYYQGDTILFDIAGVDLNFEQIDFVSRIYATTDSPIVIEKRNMTLKAPGIYTGTISSEMTAALPVGNYTHEILLRRDDGVLNSIALAPAFTLSKSSSKSEFL